MIRVFQGPGHTMEDGSTAAYSEDAHRIGDCVPVRYGDKEGTAVVVKTTLVLGGKLNLVILDVDWTSFDRSHDDGS